MTLKEEVGQAIGMKIPEEGWEGVFATLDNYGQVNTRLIIRLLIIILKRLEKNE
jgi:hypothetical protein